MDTSDQTARQFYEEIKVRPNHTGFGFGNRVAILNVDLQKAYTFVDEFKTAYATHPR